MNRKERLRIGTVVQGTLFEPFRELARNHGTKDTAIVIDDDDNAKNEKEKKAKHENNEKNTKKKRKQKTFK